MKKVLVLLVTLLLMGCYTPTINQVELYGQVESVLYHGKHYKVKVWCQDKEKYYNIITNKLYQKGDIIRIK